MPPHCRRRRRTCTCLYFLPRASTIDARTFVSYVCACVCVCIFVAESLRLATAYAVPEDDRCVPRDIPVNIKLTPESPADAKIPRCVCYISEIIATRLSIPARARA